MSKPKLTNKQREDLKTALYYAPERIRFDEPTEEDIKRYFDMSDKGIGKKEIENQIAEEGRNVVLKKQEAYSGLAKIIYGKRNRELQVTSYKDNWGTGTTAWDFVEEPEYIAKFLAKVLNKPYILKAYYQNKKNNYQRLERKYDKEVMFRL